eukprot:3749067-Pleurochrysis_carterae.AAC.1
MEAQLKKLETQKKFGLGADWELRKRSRGARRQQTEEQKHMGRCFICSLLFSCSSLGMLVCEQNDSHSS